MRLHTTINKTSNSLKRTILTIVGRSLLWHDDPALNHLCSDIGSPDLDKTWAYLVASSIRLPIVLKHGC